MRTTYTRLDVEDRPGELGRVLQCLSRAGVDVDRLSADHGRLQLWTADPQAATMALANCGYAGVNEQALEVPIGAGGLEAACMRLGEANVNIDSCDAVGGVLVLRVDDEKAARAALLPLLTA